MKRTIVVALIPVVFLPSKGSWTRLVISNGCEHNYVEKGVSSARGEEMAIL